MKALSVQQPWAWAIIHAGKDIENRTWRTQYRGVIAIHAAYRKRAGAQLPQGVRKPGPDELVLGAVIGTAEIVAVVDHHGSKWFEGPFGFVLANPKALAKPLSCKGSLGLWEVPPNLLRALRKQIGKDII
jgi:hypothetical protein